MNRKQIYGIIIALLFFASCRNFLFPERLKFSGTLEMTEHSLGARVNGKIASLRVEEGDVVKAGDMLATLDRYEQARKDYDRQKDIFQKGGLSEQLLEQSALALQDQTIIAPTDGIVLIKVRELGEVVQAGSPVVVVGDHHKLWVRIFVPEGQVNRVKIGQSASVKLDGLHRTFKAKVTYIATQAEFTPRNVQSSEERVTQTFAVKVTLDEPDISLHAGVAADVSIQVS